MKTKAQKKKDTGPYKHGDRRTVKKFAFWPTKVSDSCGYWWTLWLESYYADQQYYDPDVGSALPGYWYNKKKYII